ncbi:CvpA family protein [Patescibacteria group bacterium]|nr:CvpA family protein [Patescibacteria group bacterium]MBU0963908.1 CvpA family protein [Patescibacteria group bacterium]
MGTFDIILLLLFFGFVGAGFYFGLIHTLGALAGVVVGVIAAGSLYNEITPFLQLFMLKESVAQVLSFIIIFLVVSRVIGYMVHMFDKGFKIIKFIPFASSINRLGGGLIGFFEATLVLGTILYVASQFQLSPYLDQAIANSAFAGLLMTIASILTPLLPGVFKIKVI